MKILEVPVYDEDGGIKFTQYVSPEEAQSLLQFAINFLLATGMHARKNMTIISPFEPEDKQELDD